MVFAATLAIIAEATISTLGINWSRGVEARMTVEIPAVEDESSTPQSERIQQALSILRGIPGVKTATPVSDAETLGLLKPWITDDAVLKSLPIPSLIDIERTSGSSLSADDVRSKVKSAIPDASVDDHATWLTGLSTMVGGLIILAVVMALLAAFTLAITVGLFCRAVMAGEGETITLLHTMGADDNDIAMHFQSLTIRLSWPAALLGFAIAVICMGGLLFSLGQFTDLGVIAIPHWLGLGLLAMLTPLAAVVIAALAARFSVSRLLQTIP